MSESEAPRPIVLELEVGEHAICTCGRSGNRPFCDGSHQGTGFTPVIEVVEEQPRRIAWCTCRRSATMPHCDGTHKNLEAPA